MLYFAVEQIKHTGKYHYLLKHLEVWLSIRNVDPEQAMPAYFQLNIKTHSLWLQRAAAVNAKGIPPAPSPYIQKQKK